MSLISVIIPVYNIASYLERSVDSVIVQSCSDWNLILVDDGSTDGGGEVCDSLAKIDSRITVIHQKNMGLSAARNTGIEIAIQQNSKFICFLDGDDWWHPFFLEKMVAAMKQEGTTVAVCGYCFIMSDEYKDKSFYYAQPLSEGIKVLSTEECYTNSKLIGTGACNKMYTASLLCSNRFPVGRLHEDEFFTYKILYYAEKVSLLDAKMYYYFQRPGSIMHSPSSIKKIKDKFDALYERESFFRNHGEENYANKAKETALVANAKGVIQAIEHGRYSNSEFPAKYKMSRWKALYYIHKYCSDDNYCYFLNKVYPKGLLFHEYLKKIASIFCADNRKDVY